MVIYDLSCPVGHRFEGWFPNAEAFDEQRKNELVCCSVCGLTEVEKIPSGGHMAKARITSSPASKADRVKKEKDVTVNVDPVVFVKAVNQFIQQNFKDVGSKFVDQAIRMHKGELVQEPIYGTASPKDQERLEEEGVDYTLVPKLPEEIEN